MSVATDDLHLPFDTADPFVDAADPFIDAAEPANDAAADKTNGDEEDEDAWFRINGRAGADESDASEEHPPVMIKDVDSGLVIFRSD